MEGDVTGVISQATSFFGIAMDYFTKYYLVVAEFVGTFALLATVTSNRADNKIAVLLLKGINVLGGNFWKAANGEDKDAILAEQERKITELEAKAA